MLLAFGGEAGLVLVEPIIIRQVHFKCGGPSPRIPFYVREEAKERSFGLEIPRALREDSLIAGATINR
jgi:hypothetical protein